MSICLGAIRLHATCGGLTGLLLGAWSTPARSRSIADDSSGRGVLMLTEGQAPSISMASTSTEPPTPTATIPRAPASISWICSSTGSPHTAIIGRGVVRALRGCRQWPSTETGGRRWLHDKLLEVAVRASAPRQDRDGIQSHWPATICTRSPKELATREAGRAASGRILVMGLRPTKPMPLEAQKLVAASLASHPPQTRSLPRAAPLSPLWIAMRPAPTHRAPNARTNTLRDSKWQARVRR